MCVPFDGLGYCLARCASNEECRATKGTCACRPVVVPQPVSHPMRCPWNLGSLRSLTRPTMAYTTGRTIERKPNENEPGGTMAPPSNDPPRPDANVQPLGSPCGEAVSCGAGSVCISNLPGGYCSKVCQTSDDCPDGTVGIWARIKSCAWHHVVIVTIVVARRLYL